jgi:hypothetical protein
VIFGLVYSQAFELRGTVRTNVTFMWFLVKMFINVLLNVGSVIGEISASIAHESIVERVLSRHGLAIFAMIRELNRIGRYDPRTIHAHLI